MSQPPLAVLKKRFESKEKLVAAVQKLATSELWVERLNGTKGLARVSNAKLIRLHDLLTDAKTRFGSRDKLVSAIAELAKRTKDKGYAESLGKFPLPRLLDLHRTLERASKKTSAAAPVKAKKPAAEKKAAPAAKAAPKAEAAKAEAKPAKKKSEAAPAKKSAKKA